MHSYSACFVLLIYFLLSSFTLALPPIPEFLSFLQGNEIVMWRFFTWVVGECFLFSPFFSFPHSSSSSFLQASMNDSKFVFKMRNEYVKDYFPSKHSHKHIPYILTLILGIAVYARYPHFLVNQSCKHGGCMSGVLVESKYTWGDAIFIKMGKGNEAFVFLSRSMPRMFFKVKG